MVKKFYCTDWDVGSKNFLEMGQCFVCGLYGIKDWTSILLAHKTGMRATAQELISMVWLDENCTIFLFR